MDLLEIRGKLDVIDAELVRLMEERLELCAQVAVAVQKLRSNEAILKKPSIAETLDWASALDALGIRELTPDALRRTAGFVLKNSEDLETAQQQEDHEHCHCGGHCGGHHHD